MVPCWDTELDRRAPQLIARNLERPIAVAEVARVAGMSEFHYQRTFHLETGETVGRFMTRRRLEIAAPRLAYERDRSITEIALSSGYSSSSNFGKAFTAYFGVSPSRVRGPDAELPPALGTLKTTWGHAFRPEDLDALPELEPRALRDEAAQWERVVRYETIAARTPR